MSTNKSVFTLSSLKKRDNVGDIPCRIEFIKDLMRGQKLKSLIDFDNNDTENFVHDYDDEGSYDTKVILKKRVLDFETVINSLGNDSRLEYIKSGTTGHTFKGFSTNENGEFEYAVKVVAYPKKENKKNNDPSYDVYENINDARRPENAELMMLKLLSYFIVKKYTPHIVLPFGTFNTDINTFIGLVENGDVEDNAGKYKEFEDAYKQGKYYDEVSILISEWANRGDFLDFVKKYNHNFDAIHWKVFFFQILSVLAVIHSKFPSFRHNDMKANNILVSKIPYIDSMCVYTIGKAVYKVPHIGYQIKLWDFDFACIPGIVDNAKVESKWTKRINVTPVQNRYYDMHYFFNTFIKKGFFHHFMTKDHIPQEAKDFVNRVVPEEFQHPREKVISEKGRILINTEYLTPDRVLREDPYFEEFRVKTNIGNENNQVNKNVKTTTYKNVKGGGIKTRALTKDNKQQMAMPDLTKFLKQKSKKYSSSQDSNSSYSESSESSIEIPKKKQRTNVKTVKNTKTNTKTNTRANNKTKTKSKTNNAVKNNKKESNTKKKTRTISSDIRAIKKLDPDMILANS